MRIEEHEEAYREHLANLKKAIDEGIKKNQRNIGFNVSQGSVELFAIYLHRLKVLQGSGDQFDHRIFKNKALIQKKIPFQFSGKDEILKLMGEIERERIALCYGTRKPRERIEKAITSLNTLRKEINRRLRDEKRIRSQ